MICKDKTTVDTGQSWPSYQKRSADKVNTSSGFITRFAFFGPPVLNCVHNVEKGETDWSDMELHNTAVSFAKEFLLSGF